MSLLILFYRFLSLTPLAASKKPPRPQQNTAARSLNCLGKKYKSRCKRSADRTLAVTSIEDSWRSWRSFMFTAWPRYIGRARTAKVASQRCTDFADFADFILQRNGATWRTNGHGAWADKWKGVACATTSKRELVSLALPWDFQHNGIGNDLAGLLAAGLATSQVWQHAHLGTTETFPTGHLHGNSCNSWSIRQLWPANLL